MKSTIMKSTITDNDRFKSITDVIKQWKRDAHIMHIKIHYTVIYNSKGDNELVICCISPYKLKKTSSIYKQILRDNFDIVKIHIENDNIVD